MCSIERKLQIEDFASVEAWNEYKTQKAQSDETIHQMKSKVRHLRRNYNKVERFSALMLIASILVFDGWALVPVALISAFLCLMRAPLRENRKDIIIDAIETLVLIGLVVLKVIEWRL